ncbi:MAG TPA: succinyl-diaminopimelate desuccinylase [Actinobacteria bacterium]|nr:succinyl-diaminopimelate desuccinylase [Actinomycetota bacterium]
MSDLDLGADIVELTVAVVNVPSESHHEGPLADMVERALGRLPHLEVLRIGDNVIARTHLGHSERVIIAGHLDTVPAAGNLPARVEQSAVVGLGSCDMKGGVAVALSLAGASATANRDITFVFYAAEEVEDEHNGLGRVLDARPDVLAGDLAILMEPSEAGIEAGCQGTLRAVVRTHGTRAHSARSWAGRNAIHAAESVLAILAAYEAREVDVDGLRYREGLNAVGIRGGVAGNVIPDLCEVIVNYRYAPDRTPDEAEAFVREVFSDYEIEVVDNASGARPGLDRPATQAFVAAVGKQPRPKYGWTDVARFTAIGVPAVNFGPGDPLLAHTIDEYVPVEHLRSTLSALRLWLGLD